MATIVVSDFNNVFLDGVNAGSVTDILFNHPNVPGIRGDLDRAIQAFDGARARAQADAIADLGTKHAEELDVIRAAVEEKQTLIDALGGTPLAVELRRAAERERAIEAKLAAEAARAEAEAKIAAIDAESDGKVIRDAEVLK